MAKDLRKMPQTVIERSWMFWTNPLWQQELPYRNDYAKLLNKISFKIFYETNWGFVYHQKWFYESIINFPNCPHWNCRIPNNGWDD